MAPAASAERCELIESIGTCGFDEQGVAPPDLGIIVPGVQHLVIDLLSGPCMQHIPNVTTREVIARSTLLLTTSKSCRVSPALNSQGGSGSLAPSLLTS